MEVFNDYINLLSKDLKESLFFYTTHEFTNINKNNDIPSNKHYDNITQIFKGGPVMKNTMTVYRGMTKRYKKLDEGGFISTSADKSIAKQFKRGGCCLYVITLTPGEYTLLPLESLSENPQEKEILLPPGHLSIQMIIPYSENTENVDMIYCTYIPGNSEIVDNTYCIKDETRLELSTQSWVDRILSSNIKEELELFFEKDITSDNVINELESLEYYEDIPKKAIEKVIQLLVNIKD